MVKIHKFVIVEMQNFASLQRILFLLLFLFCFIGCKKPVPTGHLQIHFTTVVDEAPLQYDILDYLNDAGNHYEVNEVRYFISRVVLTTADGMQVSIADNDGIHYYDSDIPSTYNWLIADELPVGKYESLSFVFGLDAAQNVTGFFVNPPETNMAWPDPIGGGYHYMQINGKWLNASNELTPFCLHTGIGQTYQDGEITEFVHNFFTVTLPLASLEIPESTTSEITLAMNVNNWFRNPYVYDLDEWGGAIMQNQAAQEVLRANGKNVFSVRL
ncbi:MAG: hypothetical protein J6S82_07965 [Bacteroidales bacterium]|nr:hypothetical protein [Bacteroidales bacterium]